MPRLESRGDGRRSGGLGTPSEGGLGRGGGHAARAERRARAGAAAKAGGPGRLTSGDKAETGDGEERGAARRKSWRFLLPFIRLETESGSKEGGVCDGRGRERTSRTGWPLGIWWPAAQLQGGRLVREPRGACERVCEGGGVLRDEARLRAESCF